MKLKFQAIRCSLAHMRYVNVCPCPSFSHVSRPETGADWSEDACDKFEMLTGCDGGKVVWARVVGYQASGVPSVELVDNGRRQTSLGQELLRLGVASWVEK